MNQPAWSPPPAPESDIVRLNSVLREIPSYAPSNPSAPATFGGRHLALDQWMRLPSEKPILTPVLLAIMVGVFILMAVFDQLSNLFISWGAMVKFPVLEGEWWRLVTATFLHGDFWHIGVNGIALFIIGRDVEAFFGRARFAAIYAISALGGSVCSFIFLEYFAAAVGASGAIYGVFGAMIIFNVLNRHFFGGFGRRNFRIIVALLLADLLLSLIVNVYEIVSIDHAAHIGGLLAGLVTAFVLCPRYRLGSWRNPLVREIENINTGPLPWIAAILVVLVVVATFLAALLYLRLN